MFELRDKINASKIAELRSKLKNFLIASGIDQETASDIELVASEMLTNVYKHSYKEEEGDVIIKASIDESKLVISIRDFGEKFSPPEVKKPDPEVLSDHGYGLYIASQIMDKVEYVLMHDIGTEVILTKYLKRNA
jgi:anti-sigma regulatory factor (Ser/Thr protein kinase)